MKKLSDLLRLMFIGLLACSLWTACDVDEGPAEDVGEAIDEAGDDIKDAADDAKDEIEDAVD